MNDKRKDNDLASNISSSDRLLCWTDELVFVWCENDNYNNKFTQISVATFGLYSVGEILKGVMTFNRCDEAGEELVMVRIFFSKSLVGD